jgi:tRNA(Arg) A34 adenosine deaminase TadA
MGCKRGNSIYGAEIVKDGKIIVRATNETELDNDPTAHAEIVCDKEASKVLKSRYLEKCARVYNREPCPICISAAILQGWNGWFSRKPKDDLVEYYGKRQTDILAREL